MSTTPPPDRPTEPLRPTRPPPPIDARPVAPAIDPNAILLRLEDAVRSLRSGLVIVGVIAFAALALAAYALMSDDTGAARGGGASDASVSRLDDRVDRLSRQLQDVRSGQDDKALAKQVDGLERTVKTLADRPDPSTAVQELTQRIETLEGDVEELKQSQTTP